MDPRESPSLTQGGLILRLWVGFRDANPRALPKILHANQRGVLRQYCLTLFHLISPHTEEFGVPASLKDFLMLKV